jgi:hypothetical protein
MKRRLYTAGLMPVLLIFLCGTLTLMARHSAARDYLTPQEEERVKEAQVLDKRIEVFIKVAERRMLALTDPGASSGKQAQKDMEKWGEIPKGTRAELIMDIANVFDAAITNIDDVALRDERNSLLPKALHKLAEAASRFQKQFASMREQLKSEQERAAVEKVMENIEEILGAANKISSPEKK